MYDDLSAIAMAYREISLLLRRSAAAKHTPAMFSISTPASSSAFFKMSKERGGGLLTALPVIETQAGDVSAYIPTTSSPSQMARSLETDLFNSGIRPAVNVGLLVSRVGFSAAVKAVKQVGSTLKLDLAQHRAAAAAAAAAGLGPVRLRPRPAHPEAARPRSAPYRAAQAAAIPAAHPAAADDHSLRRHAGLSRRIPCLSDIRAYEDGLYKFFDDSQKALVADITEKKSLDDDLCRLHAALKEYSANFKADLAAAKA